VPVSSPRKNALSSGHAETRRYGLKQSDLADKHILDLGAGNQPISAPIECRQKFFADIRVFPRTSLICNLLNGIPFADDSVDAIVAGEIIEHIAHSRRFLQEMRRVLKANGVLVLSTPNIVSLKYRIAFLLGRIPAHAARADYTYDADNPASDWGHVRDYSFSELRRVLTDQEFIVTEEKGIGMFWRDRQIVPAWMMPKTFSDQIIVKAIARAKSK
jgi:SAM-dependent methyltransferase